MVERKCSSVDNDNDEDIKKMGVDCLFVVEFTDRLHFAIIALSNDETPTQLHIRIWPVCVTSD